jgi:hypothetical protein
MEGKNFMGRTPLLEAAFSGHPRAVARLLFLGADVNAEDNEGWSARQVAEFVGHGEVVDVIITYLKMKNGPDKRLPAPDYHSKYYNDAKKDFAKAKKESMKAEYRRDTYKAADQPLNEWVMDIKFKKYMQQVGPGQSVFEYDIREQRDEYNRTYFGDVIGNGRGEGGRTGYASSNSSVSGLSERSVASNFYETRPVSPFPTTEFINSGGEAGTMTIRLNTADGNVATNNNNNNNNSSSQLAITRPVTSSSVMRQTLSRSGSRTAVGSSRVMTTGGGGGGGGGTFHHHHKKEWLVKEPYDSTGGMNSAEEMKRTRDLREMARMERRREFDKTLKPKAAGMSALLR